MNRRKMYCKQLCLFLLGGLNAFFAEAQQLRNPFDFPIYLSGNFGELRSNHFHSGIDFKTQGVEGKTIYAVQEGYISRILVSPWGYGNAIYITHPDSLMTVYGHMQKFTDKVTAYVKSRQYEQENFAIDLFLSPEEFPVKKSDVIGYSGNTGGSGGPHLHFEVRDMRTEEPIDPLPFYKEQIKDTRPPMIQSLMVYPIQGEGIVNGSVRKQKIQLITSKDGKQSIKEKMEAWGEIAFSINVDDYMDGTNNVYGVKELTMLVDSQEVFHSCLDRFSFSETRYLNAWVDYEEWKEKKSFYTKTFVEPGNRLRFITSKNRGVLTINEPRTYCITFQLADAFGNRKQFTIDVTGKEQAFGLPDTINTSPFYWSGENRFGAKGIRLFIPRGSLYNDLFFYHKATLDSAYLSDIHTLHDKPVPLHQPAKLSLHLSLNDTLSDKRQYGIVSVHNKKHTWIGGTYRDRWIDAEIKELGTYAVMQDTVCPKITPVGQTKWVAEGVLTFRLTDNLSGVSTYRGEIDGQYVLFGLDGKKSLIEYTFDPERLSRGKHTITLTVSDACGNSAFYETFFTW